MGKGTGALYRGARLLTAVALAAGLAACSAMKSEQDPDVEYQGAASGRPLETPPDLIRPALDRQYEIPDLADQPIDRNRVLPIVERARLVRVGAQSWLEIDMPAAELWPRLQDFWRQHDYPMERDDPLVGVQETAWIERRPVVPRTGVGYFLGRLFSEDYSGSLRDRFRLRLERGERDDGQPLSRVFLSHWTLARRLLDPADSDNAGAAWSWVENDGSLRGELLLRMLVSLGIEEQKARGLLGEADLLRLQQRAYLDGDDQGTSLVLNQSFHLSWSQLVDALENLGMEIEDSERERGVMLVAYVGPDPAATAAAEEVAAPGLLQGLFSSDDGIERDYRVEVLQEPGRTRVRLVELDAQGGDAAVTERFYQRLLERFQ